MQIDLPPYAVAVVVIPAGYTGFTGAPKLHIMSRLLTRKAAFMGDPAQETKNDPLAIEGLEEVFKAEDSPPLDLAQGQPRSGQINAEAGDSPAQDWTVSQAAKRLGISEKTVLRRLQRGSLPGYKISGQFGLEWRINRAAPDSSALDRQGPPPRSGHIDVEAVDSPAQDSIVQELKDEIVALRRQLEGAIYRNGYLEAKLEERDTTIKLLTDSQHKHSRWGRFMAWFLGKTTELP